MRPGRRSSPRGRRPSVDPVLRQGAYRVHDDVGRRLWAGHPWVYREALGGRRVSEPSGALVDVLGGAGQFVGRGFVDAEHAVAIRLVTRDAAEDVRPGAGALARRLVAALELRRALFPDGGPDAMRLFWGDSEGFPGVIVDRYRDFVVVQWLAEGALAWREELYATLADKVRPRGLYEQMRLRPLAGGGPPAQAAIRVAGEEAPVELVIDEQGCKLAVDVTAPLGVGFFPDLRLGRDRVAARAAGRRVLNLFSYTGAFSVRAAKAGAAEVVAVDTAAKAHARARRNLDLSGLPATGMETLTADAQQALARFAGRERRFDLVICDPPTFSHGPGGAGTFSVAADLAELCASCLAVLDRGGLLALATNSWKLGAQDLDRALAEGATRQGVEVRVVERCGLPPDFPVAPAFPEGNYLKFLIAARL